MLVSAGALTGGSEVLSEAERQRRERQRTAALRGIVDYAFAPDGKSLMFPLNGQIYWYALASGDVRQLTGGDDTITDPQISPTGEHVAFIRNRNLHVVDVATGTTRALTTSAGPLIANGVAEFIAQEEMDRDTGYWWSPDGRSIAFLETDESPVAVERRFEVLAESVRIVDQRYPATGTANVRYRLGIAALDGSPHRWLPLGTNDQDIYIAAGRLVPRLQRKLAVQRQSRDQQTLELLALPHRRRLRPTYCSAKPAIRGSTFSTT